MLNMKESIFKKFARFVKYNKLFALFIIIFSLLVYILVFSNNGLIQRFEINSEKSKLEKTLKDEQQKNEAYQQEIKDLNTSDFKIEQVAREKYGLTKEGETIYKIIADTTKN
jgi:cell division protein FtsB